MSPKALIWIGVFIGSAVGSYIPLLWGGSAFSVSSAFLGMIGGIAGIWAGFRLSKMI